MGGNDENDDFGDINLDEDDDVPDDEDEDDLFNEGIHFLQEAPAKNNKQPGSKQ